KPAEQPSGTPASSGQPDGKPAAAKAGGGPAGGAAGERPAKARSTVEVMRPGIVKVIPGTRRYHSTACPLIKGSDPATLETMARPDAEAAGLTHCSVCDTDD
ncbi:hypothetical protein, partial [Sphaerisporangium rufum]|uniref:hypothetical protein n=1 Tax=Sphaerisporangium rufum TaxID=1381558 RepID=UPI0019518AB6